MSHSLWIAVLGIVLAFVVAYFINQLPPMRSRNRAGIALFFLVLAIPVTIYVGRMQQGTPASETSAPAEIVPPTNAIEGTSRQVAGPARSAKSVSSTKPAKDTKA